MMGIENREHIVTDRVNAIITLQVQGEPEVRAVTDRNWELPVVLFQEAGYSEDQVVAGLVYRFMSNQQQGELPKPVHFLGILPPVEEVSVRVPYSGLQHTKEELEE